MNKVTLFIQHQTNCLHSLCHNNEKFPCIIQRRSIFILLVLYTTSDPLKLYKNFSFIVLVTKKYYTTHI